MYRRLSMFHNVSHLNQFIDFFAPPTSQISLNLNLALVNSAVHKVRDIEYSDPGTFVFISPLISDDVKIAPVGG